MEAFTGGIENDCEGTGGMLSDWRGFEKNIIFNLKGSVLDCKISTGNISINKIFYLISYYRFSYIIPLDQNVTLSVPEIKTIFVLEKRHSNYVPGVEIVNFFYYFK